MANTTLQELRRKVVLGLPNIDGEEILIVNEAINQACSAIAKIKNFEDLIALKTDSVTVASTQRYQLTGASLNLTRPKDIISMRVYNTTLSAKLTYVDYREMDEKIPYPLTIAEAQPQFYTRQGEYVEFIPVPDAVYTLYIRYAQWPLVLSANTDVCSYANLDPEIVALSRDIYIAMKTNSSLDYLARARQYLSLATKEETSIPDDDRVARPFRAIRPVLGEYWKDPFYRD